MTVWHINHTENDGLFSVIESMQKDLTELGCNSFILTKKSSVFNKSVFGKVNIYYIHFIYWINRVFRKIFTHNKFYFYNFFDFGRLLNHKLILKNYPNPDIIILYWISGFLNSKDIELLKANTGAKIYWYLMDMAPITGGCHYFGSCENFTENCQKCPAFKIKFINFISSNNLTAKSKKLKNNIDGFIAASETMLKDLYKSRVGQGIKMIGKYISIDQNLFITRNKLECRKHFKFHSNKFTLFASAKSLKDQRKGFRFVIEALDFIKSHHHEVSKDIILIVAGSIDRKEVKLIPIEHYSLGFLDLNNLALAYNICDVFINSSVEDAGPMMVNQALMSGTPIISFPVGVAKDLVIEEKTGFITNSICSKELAEKILAAYNAGFAKIKFMGNNARKQSVELYGHETSKNILKKLINT